MEVQAVARVCAGHPARRIRVGSERAATSLLLGPVAPCQTENVSGLPGRYASRFECFRCGSLILHEQGVEDLEAGRSLIGPTGLGSDHPVRHQDEAAGRAALAHPISLLRGHTLRQHERRPSCGPGLTQRFKDTVTVDRQAIEHLSELGTPGVAVEAVLDQDL
jgi:hypothetical protein